MSQELTQEFWEKLETESEIGNIKILPYIYISEGSLVTTSIMKSDGSGDCFQSLQWGTASTKDPGKKRTPALVLVSIYLPDSLQRQGIGTRVIETLEARARREGKILGIDTVASEAMGKLCKKLNFIECLPRSCYKMV